MNKLWCFHPMEYLFSDNKHQFGWISKASERHAEWKNQISKDYVLYDLIYMTVSKEQSYSTELRNCSVSWFWWWLYVAIQVLKSIDLHIHTHTQTQSQFYCIMIEKQGRRKSVESSSSGSPQAHSPWGPRPSFLSLLPLSQSHGPLLFPPELHRGQAMALHSAWRFGFAPHSSWLRLTIKIPCTLIRFP